MKSVLLVVIDALASRIVRPAMESGRLPHFSQLVEQGGVNWECLSVFPSITPTATSSIVTGRYPGEHRVMGAHYFDRSADKVFYFGSDMWVILTRSFSNYFDDFLLRLNGECLEAPTMFELLEQQGRRCASLNFLVFRGREKHKVNVPWLLRLAPGVRHAAELPGPEILSLGKFVAEESRGSWKDELQKEASGLFDRYGFNDDNTGQLLLQLEKEGFPDFTLAYFPDNDFRSHEVGPAEAVDKLESIDAWLGKLFDQAGGCAELLQKIQILITGDHSQSDVISDDKLAGIDLAETLLDYKVAAAGSDWSNGEELMICPNLRAAQIYCRDAYREQIGEIAAAILSDQRVDQVIWREGQESGAMSPDDRGEPVRFHVATSDRGTLSFSHSDDPSAARDEFGGGWSLHGSLDAVNARLDENQISYDDYPNALERIAACFDRRYAGDVWATAKAGYEFEMENTEIHPGGGSHGSLHRDDSTSPLIVAGLPEASQRSLLSQGPIRTVDLLPVCLDLLDLTSTRGVREPHRLPSTD